MPRKKVSPAPVNGSTVPSVLPLEATLNEVRVLLEARQQEFQSSADRITDILLTLQPKPRIGRPPKVPAV